MKKGCVIAILTTLGIIVLFVGLVYWSFLPEYKIVEIPQKIGGKLICEMEYHSDHHSWDYYIEYKYQSDSLETENVGKGVYSGREWNEDEQLKKFDNWIVLQTGNYHGSDKIIYRKTKSKKWKEFEFTPENIRKDNLWISQNIQLLPNWLPSESLIKEITKDKIIVTYEYRTDENNAELTEKKILEYLISEQTEKPVLEKITNYNNTYSK
jgi:hypothetical protein